MTITVKFETDHFRFSYEGPADLLETKVRDFADHMVRLADDCRQSSVLPDISPAPVQRPAAMPNLAQYFTALKPKTQILRFLATATWLQEQGKEPLTTRRVSETLRLNKQQKLGNASDCLQKNILAGHCERNGDHPQAFFVTETGLIAARADLLTGGMGR